MNQTVVGAFAMVLIVEMGDGAVPLISLKDKLEQTGRNPGVGVYAQTEDLFAMHRL